MCDLLQSWAGNSHSFYIAASYGITAVVFAACVIWPLITGVGQKREIREELLRSES